MSEIKEKSKVKIDLVTKNKNFFNKFYYKFMKVISFFIPRYFKKKKILKNEGEGAGLPYIVCVENNTSKAVYNIELFGSYDMLTRDVFDKKGNYVSRGLKISSGMFEISYKDMLYQMHYTKFSVGLTYIQTVNKEQVLLPLKVVKKMISGNLNETILNFSKDPHQHQTNIFAVKWNYEIDGLTTVVIPTLEPKTKANFYFYPESIAYKKVKKENFGFRFFKSISDYFKKEKIVKVLGMPYRIEVANYTDEVKENVSVFGTYHNISKNEKRWFNKDNNLIFNDVLISSLNPNISYAEMLCHISNNPLKIGSAFQNISRGNNNQIFSSIKITTKDANGNMAQKTLIPTICPYQYQIDVVNMEANFSIDGFTEFIISELSPKTTVVYDFYPETEEKQ
jgi:hypothetical protein